MKKGFTLIEMLGIIAVLALILLVTFPILTSSLKQISETKENNYIKNLKPGAEAYVELNREKFTQLNTPGNEITFKVQDLYDSNLFKGQYEGISADADIIVESAQDGTLNYYFVPTPETEVFNYDGREQRLQIERTGIYKLEVWGAQGGSQDNNLIGGYGGYSSGMIKLNAGTKLYINVGGTDQRICEGDTIGTCYGGYNGGGNSNYANNEKWGAGGGATHIALKSGLLSSLSNDIDKILIVSGGGGGTYSKPGGNAGGYIGVNGYEREDFTQALGGTQNSGGQGVFQGNFGQGGICLNGNCSGGGAGFYGGGASIGTSAAGGSSYIGNSNLTNAVMYCYGCEENGDDGLKTISTTGTYKDAVNCPNGYSSSALTNCAKADNGYAKITLVRIEM